MHARSAQVTDLGVSVLRRARLWPGAEIPPSGAGGCGQGPQGGVHGVAVVCRAHKYGRDGLRPQAPVRGGLAGCALLGYAWWVHRRAVALAVPALWALCRTKRPVYRGWRHCVCCSGVSRWPGTGNKGSQAFRIRHFCCSCKAPGAAQCCPTARTAPATPTVHQVQVKLLVCWRLAKAQSLTF